MIQAVRSRTLVKCKKEKILRQTIGTVSNSNYKKLWKIGTANIKLLFHRFIFLQNQFLAIEKQNASIHFLHRPNRFN